MDECTVLFVDDEKNVLTSLERLFIREPYHTRFANSGREALELLESEPAHVVVSDMRMPDMDGLTLLRQVKETWPDAIRIALSAHTGLPQVLASINTGEVYRYLTKPLSPPDEIITVVRQAIELYRLRRDQRDLTASLAKRNRELEQTLAQVQQLQRMLPICANCKNNQTDGMQNAEPHPEISL